jgi:hypothetical protein
MPFDPNTSTIAITVPSFTFKKGASSILFEDITDLIYSEPYLVTIAIDGNGVATQSLDFNFAEYPNIRRGGTVNMIGNGHLVYGPGNPGEFVATSVLLMESSRDAKNTGDDIIQIVQSKAVDMGIAAAIGVDPRIGTTLRLMQELTNFVAIRLQSTRDKYLFRTEGVFFRNTKVPYEVNRQFVSGNEFAELTVQVIPLDQPNGQGPTTQAINIQPQ